MKVTKVGIKEGRIPCCGKDCPQRDNAEHEGYAGVLTDKRITENNNTDADSKEKRLLERILSLDSLNTAYKQVKSKKGAHGIDGMEVEHLLQYLKVNGEELTKSILEGKYHPNPVRRVEIPKDSGKMRTLGIPTAVDRVIQQAIAQELEPIFEPQFAETSYGFRPKRSAHDALRSVRNTRTKGILMSLIWTLKNFSIQ
ncbi:Reverse transcriptase (RNA-dependent DNA polymerase) [Pelosinus fermentans]|jgi:retron-type reverse transcriptase|uniref:RNA-directed DNA polymerase (Reverse transcriptase) n=1 Tax=Pelosinus fermentans B4 TaxID=1149862 RepID=I8RJH7_9FIRM|nr:MULTISPECIES: reverse transcriptase domain-containing protein [Pelosinus]EIW18315.1 RNA-directed DNA polymerase (Reverse transcriptase) [Pelosinus fermentans B4]EIW24301.1 RNA-directed DNA polymerase (Reverse transcriptase) [Pelosinus fermentans A11]OAM94253.1 RNA-directed DNA polymerase (Reverse transcriptase) [Pelosinus fermentans DSM 17108]SDR04190.1 Reverse transcriptase (RNA-dependent DNA polymerase) [Pelosinus fermentans]